MIDQISRVMEPLRHRVMLLVGRAVLRAVQDGAGHQRLQVEMLAGETRDEVRRMQNYGLASVPLTGAECVVLCLGGNRDHPIAVTVDDARHRPSGLGAGEVALYTHLNGGSAGHAIILRADGSVLVRAERVRMETTELEVTGDVKVAGDVRAGAVSLRNHRHGGVAAGAAQSGLPA